jgi:hypothetical protein
VHYKKMKLPRGCKSSVREALKQDGVAILWEFTDGTHVYRDHNKMPWYVKLMGRRENRRTMVSMFTVKNDWQAPNWDVDGMKGGTR